MTQLSIFHLQEQVERIKSQPTNISLEQVATIFEKTVSILEGRFNYNFSAQQYASYKIELIDNNKIGKIYFKVGDEKFLVYIDYDFSLFRTQITNYSEPGSQKEELKTINIKGLRVLGIQKKVNVGYSEIKQSPNYFRYFGLDEQKLKSFIEGLVKSYHTI